ncbi:MAG: GNAT family N-acetyltransferase [Flavobacteriaceae bacterium]|nr:MAG: GNAT family N-acetyltransferase [Flavobacteriaceae bacterium]
MDAVIVRQATLKDLDVLLKFEQGIIKAERPFDATLEEDPIHYYDLKTMILDADAEVLVAEKNNEIISSGYAVIKEAKSYLNHKTYAYLGFMYTHPDYRGHGINARIISVLKEWSFSKGLKEIRLTVYNDNQAAIKAYEKVGFERHLIEMRLK